MPVNDVPLDIPDVDGDAVDVERGLRLEVERDDGLGSIAVPDERGDVVGGRGDIGDLH